MPLEGLMSLWERKEQECGTISQTTPLPTWEPEEIEDFSWNDDDEYPELREYRQVLINSPAYAWLASTLTAELQHETLGEDRRTTIHQTISNMLGTETQSQPQRIPTCS